ncbi:MAG: tetratricopeptide repeat protein [Deltaproteobacteria bacterium]|nr:tetratricopeptide repeat protein [Deltaproteobacteria bacterium]
MSNEDFWAVIEEGEDYYDEGDYESALDRFDRAVNLSPSNADAHNSRGNALMMLGRHEDALGSFEQALRLDAGFVKASLNRAELLVDYLGRSKEGEEVSRHLLKRPLDLYDAADAYFVLAKAALGAGDLRAAVSMTDKALGLSPARAEFTSLRGGILFEQGNYRKALAEFDKVVKQLPDDADIHYRRGLVLEKLGRDADAGAAFARAAEMDPEHYPLPAEISVEECERIIDEVIQSFEPEVHRFIENVTIQVEDFASRRIVSEDNVSPQVLGLFVGTPYQEKTSIAQATGPDVILIFRKSLEKIAGNREELVDEIRKTLLHEVGHYLGFEEHELHDLGFG